MPNAHRCQGSSRRLDPVPRPFVLEFEFAGAFALFELPMPSKKYAIPPFLAGRCEPAAYVRWLDRKERAHVIRDRGRGNMTATREEYMGAIHRAVLASDGRDAYTGAPLAWDLISTYSNEGSQAGRRSYKRTLA